MREEVREQLRGLTDEEFAAHLPSWDNLAPEAQEQKILLARDELLRVLDRAGYQVRRKKTKDPRPLAQAESEV